MNMESKIIFGVSAIFALLFFASGNVPSDECIDLPNAPLILQQCHLHWKTEGKSVSNDTSVESRNGLMHCFTKCLYEKMGIFHDGRFDVNMIKDYVDYKIHHPMNKYFLEMNALAADLANKGGGTDCQIADNFWIYNNRDPLKAFKRIMFCEKDPWLNPE